MRDSFTKTDPRGEGSLVIEALGLRWLAEADGAPVVGVLESSPTALTLEQLGTARPSRQQAHEFGSALAHTHAAGAPSWGAAPPGWDRPEGWIGTQTMPLVPASSWGQMYADQRMLPFLDRAARQFDTAERAVFDRVLQRLRDGDFDDVAEPARIHGDLWAGNAHATDAGIVLIDPAAHGGHPVTDLAMLDLFGYPHLASVFEGYEAAPAEGRPPLPAGWRELIGLHQLHPLLVHTVTHSPSYGRQALELARRYA